MVEEQENWIPLTMHELEVQRAEARELFKRATGLELPVLAGDAPRGSSIRECEGIPQEIPFGPLLYPCSGSDHEEVLRWFGHAVSTCHFADPFNPPLVRHLRTQFTRIVVPYIGNVQIGTGRSWSLHPNNSPCTIEVHQKDGLLTLLQDIDSLSVFFYRGDSHGEGGSDQLWLWPILFEVVLSKLLEGGLVCTDGSNSDLWDERFETYSPFAALGDRSPAFIPRSKVGDRITWGPRELHCIAELESRTYRGKMRVWRVNSRNLGPGAAE